MVLNPLSPSRALPYVALMINALVWGASWWPLREIQQAGLHPLLASSAVYLIGCIVIFLFTPWVWREFKSHPALLCLALASGCTMVGFNWGVTIGDVIRVVLLFYLMPIWALLLAKPLLNEAITRSSVFRIVLAFAGAFLVLNPAGDWSFPVPAHPGEWLGLLGGFAFAINNILLRHQQARSEQARLFSMFVGGAFFPLLVAIGLMVFQPFASLSIALPTQFTGYGILVLLVFSACLTCANYGLQYGASRLPANVTAVVMLSEVVFATVSAMVLNDDTVSLRAALGGLMIVVAAAFSAVKGQHPK